MTFRRVVLETPYAGNTSRNMRYLRACMRDCLLRDEAPFASHGLYTQEGVLKDHVPKERALGIDAGFAWRDAAEVTVVYTDLGISSGMEKGIEHAKSINQVIEYRQLGGEWTPQVKTPEIINVAHTWEIEYVDAGYVDGNFWICHVCGASGGPADLNDSAPPTFDPFLAGEGLKLSYDCQRAKQQIEKHLKKKGHKLCPQQMCISRFWKKRMWMHFLDVLFEKAGP